MSEGCPYPSILLLHCWLRPLRPGGGRHSLARAQTGERDPQRPRNGRRCAAAALEDVSPIPRPRQLRPPRPPFWSIRPFPSPESTRSYHASSLRKISVGGRRCCPLLFRVMTMDHSRAASPRVRMEHSFRIARAARVASPLSLFGGIVSTRCGWCVAGTNLRPFGASGDGERPGIRATAQCA